MKSLALLLTSVLLVTWVHSAQAAVPHPHIRVGLYTTTEPVTITANKPVALTANKTTVQTVAVGETVNLSYDLAAGLYHAQTNNWEYSNATPIRITPITKPTVLTLTNYTNRPSWNPTLNDNAFLGSIELGYSAATQQLWVINNLGIENYVAGVAEAGNNNPSAYLQTLYTAARSYAYFNYLHPTKHVGEPYLVDTSPNDQVYRGYNFTARAPNILAAVRATRGQIVTYNNEPVVTPYFSQSDGRTRAWSEIWNGDQPYLLSQPDPCCTTDTLLGHGVGLSAKGARYFAEQGWSTNAILQYYYKDIVVEKRW